VKLQPRCESLPNISFRKGNALSDRAMIIKTIWSERMNPLSTNPNNFTIATDSNGSVVAFGQLKHLATDTLELSSIVVLPPYRGAGLGSKLVKHLLEHRHPPNSKVYLTTISKRRRFYSNLGFKEEILPSSDALPSQLGFEVAAGSIVARLLANDTLIVMKYP
jgi:N-acetylglutamate synthase-like GNAT family acetyltransferase